MPSCTIARTCMRVRTLIRPYARPITGPQAGPDLRLPALMFACPTAHPCTEARLHSLKYAGGPEHRVGAQDYGCWLQVQLRTRRAACLKLHDANSVYSLGNRCAASGPKHWTREIQVLRGCVSLGVLGFPDGVLGANARNYASQRSGLCLCWRTIWCKVGAFRARTQVFFPRGNFYCHKEFALATRSICMVSAIGIDGCVRACALVDMNQHRSCSPCV